MMHMLIAQSSAYDVLMRSISTWHAVLNRHTQALGTCKHSIRSARELVTCMCPLQLLGTSVIAHIHVAHVGAMYMVHMGAS